MPNSEFIRLDKAEIIKPQFTDNGLVATVSVCRDGILNYQRADGRVIREFRPRESNEALVRAINDLLTPLPITDEHPITADGGMVKIDNIAALMKGTGSNAFIYDDSDGVGHVANRAWVYDRELIDRIVDGTQNKLSLGYRCKPLPEPGTWRGERYDFVQTAIAPNHEAVTRAPRGGDSLKFHFDSFRFDADYDLNQFAYEVEEYHDSTQYFTFARKKNTTRRDTNVNLGAVPTMTTPTMTTAYSMGNSTYAIPQEYAFLTDRIDALLAENANRLGYIEQLEAELSELRQDALTLAEAIEDAEKIKARRDGYVDTRDAQLSDALDRLDRAETKLEELGLVDNGEDWVLLSRSDASEEDWEDEEDEDEDEKPKRKRGKKGRQDSFEFLVSENENGEAITWGVIDSEERVYYIDSVVEELSSLGYANTQETIALLLDASRTTPGLMSHFDSEDAIYPASPIDVYRLVLESRGVNLGNRTDSQIEDLYEYEQQKRDSGDSITPLRAVMDFLPTRTDGLGGSCDCAIPQMGKKEDAWKLDPMFTRK